jgi:hypothetical protein
MSTRVIVIIRLKPFWRPGTVPRRLAALGARAVGATVVLPFIATTVADIPAVRTRPIPAIVWKAESGLDPRIARLEKFFKIYHCPSPHHSVEYLRAADGYGLDYRLLPAVSIRETLCGVSEKQQNNHWGYHRESFTSIEEGIDFLARRLTRHPLYRGKAVRDILFTYNPLPAYPEEVRRIMQQIE